MFSEIDRKLLVAVDIGNLNGIKHALLNGANIHLTFFDKQSFLHIIPFGNIEVLALLLENGANIEAQDVYGATPLHHAAQNNDVAKIEFLIKQGANLHAKNLEDLTPLHYAAFNDRLESSQYLVRHGADVFAHSRRGEFPVDLVTKDPCAAFYNYPLILFLRTSMDQRELSDQIKTQDDGNQFLF